MDQRMILALALAAVAFPTAVFASPDQVLLDVYAARADLRKAFDVTENYRAVPNSAAGFLVDIEDWAEQYGWREYETLSAYAPTAAPERVSQAAEPAVGASSYVVIDRTSGQILAAKNAGTPWPVASLSKLMTAQIVLDSGLALDGTHTVTAADDVGGARLYVADGDTFTLDSLLYATLVGSANNAANAVARATGMQKSDFVSEMNRRAKALNLSHTAYVDPTGIETGNVSTAREEAVIANQAFSRRDVRRYTTTAAAKISVLSQGTVKTIKNTNWMLWHPEYDDIYVMAGKTGYLDESGWNLAVALRPDVKNEKRELLVVLFGAASRAASFEDADALATWAWANYR